MLGAVSARKYDVRSYGRQMSYLLCCHFRATSPQFYDKLLKILLRGKRGLSPVYSLVFAKLALVGVVLGSWLVRQ